MERGRLDLADRAAAWRFARSVARVAPVEDILAEYATSICGRPVRRQEHSLPGRRQRYLTWAIDGELVVEFLPRSKGPDLLLVHDVGVLAPIKKQIRTRHVIVQYRT